MNPLSLKIWSCCRSLSLIKLLLEYLVLRKFSKAYRSFSVNSSVGILSIHDMVSMSHLLVEILFVRSDSILL